MENITNNNNAAAGNMQAADAEVKKKNRRSKKKKTTTRPKLKPVTVSLRAGEFDEDDDDLESGLGYGDIMVVPPPTPRDKLQSDLHRLTEEINTYSKFTPEWFKVKAELAVVQVKLDEWNENTPTAAKNHQMMDNKPVVTTNAAYQDFLKFINNEEESKLLTTSTSKEGGGQPLQQKDPTKKKKKKKSSSRSKIRPKLTPQSVVEKEEEEGDEEDGLGFNDILLTKKQQNNKTVVVDVDEHTLLLDQVAAANVEECQEVVCRSNNVGEWIFGGVIGTLLFVLAFKFLLH